MRWALASAFVVLFVATASAQSSKGHGQVIIDLEPETFKIEAAGNHTVELLATMTIFCDTPTPPDDLPPVIATRNNNSSAGWTLSPSEFDADASSAPRQTGTSEEGTVHTFFVAQIFTVAFSAPPTTNGSDVVSWTIGPSHNQAVSTGPCTPSGFDWALRTAMNLTIQYHVPSSTESGLPPSDAPITSEAIGDTPPKDDVANERLSATTAQDSGNMVQRDPAFTGAGGVPQSAVAILAAVGVGYVIVLSLLARRSRGGPG